MEVGTNSKPKFLAELQTFIYNYSLLSRQSTRDVFVCILLSARPDQFELHLLLGKHKIVGWEVVDRNGAHTQGQE